MGKRLKDIYPHATKWQVFKYRVIKFTRKVFWFSTAIGTLYLAGWFGSTFYPKTLYAVQEKFIQIESPSAVMDRIANCESKGQQFRNGQVLVVGNKNGSVDMGKYQINISIWGKKATELGYDLTTEKGNTDMAMWLYKNKGTEPWVHSKKCWQG